MTWTVTNLVIEIIAGVVGAHAIAAAAKEHSFGVIGHTIASLAARSAAISCKHSPLPSSIRQARPIKMQM